MSVFFSKGVVAEEECKGNAEDSTWLQYYKYNPWAHVCCIILIAKQEDVEKLLTCST